MDVEFLSWQTEKFIRAIFFKDKNMVMVFTLGQMETNIMEILRTIKGKMLELTAGKMEVFTRGSGTLTV